MDSLKLFMISVINVSDYSVNSGPALPVQWCSDDVFSASYNVLKGLLS